MNLVELVLDVHGLLDSRKIAHAFGGALALAYYADPRGTQDVDVNVFVEFASAGPVVDLFSTRSFAPTQPEAEWLPLAGVRLGSASGPFRLDLFFSLGERYESVRQRVVRAPFGDGRTRLPFLSAEDLAVFKLSFGRDKDWVDLRQMAAAGSIVDIDYVAEQLLALRGPIMHPRLARLRRIVREAAPPGS